MKITTIDYVQVWTDLMPDELSDENWQRIYAAVNEANRLADEAGRDHDESLDTSWCEDAVKAYRATAQVAPRELIITGAEARELIGWVVTYVKPGYGWTEVQVLDSRLSGCDHGCKLYVRENAEQELVFQLTHSTLYGCALGADRDTRSVSVKVDVTGL